MLTACGREASHIPNPVLLPGQAVSTGIANAAYGARRARVARHVAVHHPTLMTEIAAGGGPKLSQAMDLARVRVADRPALIRRLQQDRALYAADREALIVALMVHGG
ncbi:hypothetical protein [Actibacterium ureilyticum]|uniref:hypothetical protein n=1 Tax=Actibacterium ureilyticum TaxID=1590614 RepID=UPI000BAAC595|nr:hypothetical protein [Actibacterium ureilyticum]